MCKILRDIGGIEKKDRNQLQNFNFRGIDAVYNELHPHLARNNVFCLPKVLEEKTEERQTKKGANLIYRILKIEFTFCAEDGSSVSATVIGEAMDSGDKAANKAMAIAHKYALLQIFCIPTEEQKDPDYDSWQVEAKKRNHPVYTLLKGLGVEESIFLAYIQAQMPESKFKAITDISTSPKWLEACERLAKKILSKQDDSEPAKFIKPEPEAPGKMPESDIDRLVQEWHTLQDIDPDLIERVAKEMAISSNPADRKQKRALILAVCQNMVAVEHLRAETAQGILDYHQDNEPF
jgi:hypothetical protein